MKNTIMKSMVALLLLWGTAACTDEVLVDMEKPGIENNSPEAGRITSLKNILPDAKPGYQGVDGRAETSTAWNLGDELLLKVEIKSDETTVAYTAWMTLVYDNQSWNIKENAYFAQKAEAAVVNVYETLPLVTPTTGIILNGTGANFEAIIPEEINEKNLLVSMFYAPDLEWKQNNNNVALGLKENPSTYAPEFWKVIVENGTTQWSTDLARVKVQVQSSDIVEGDVLALTAKNYIVSPYAEAYVENTETETPEVQPVESSEEKTYLATSDAEGYAYFYGTLAETTSDFNISLKQVKISSSDAAEQPSLIDAFIPTTLFEANTLTKVTLSPGLSYSLDGTAARTQALNDSKEAIITQENEGKKTYTVSGVKGLLQWAADLNMSDGYVNHSLVLTEDIILPQYQIKSEGDASDSNNPLVYTYSNTPISYDEDGMPTNSNWIKINKGSDGKGFTVSINGRKTGGKNAVISGLRLNSNTFIEMVDISASVENLTFVDAMVKGDGNTAVITSHNKGTIKNCTVTNSLVNGVGDVGAIAATNIGIIEKCHNNSTTIIGSVGTSGTRSSELVGGIVGHNVGEGLKDNQTLSQGTVKDCTNSGNVISNGSLGHNFTGGIVGHSYGFVTNCKNTGNVKSGTDCKGSTQAEGGGYYTSVGGVVGNSSFGRIIACVNEGNVESTTGKVTDKTTHNRVGGIVGYAGTNTYVVACGNIGKVTYANATNNHVGGIVGQLYHSYPQVTSSVPGKVYGSWTKDVNEVTLGTEDPKDGVGSLYTTASNGQVNITEVYKDASAITNMDNLKTAIDTYNQGKSENEYCSWTWSYTSGSWPTLTPGTTSTNP